LGDKLKKLFNTTAGSVGIYAIVSQLKMKGGYRVMVRKSKKIKELEEQINKLWTMVYKLKRGQYLECGLCQDYRYPTDEVVALLLEYLNLDVAEVPLQLVKRKEES